MRKMKRKKFRKERMRRRKKWRKTRRKGKKKMEYAGDGQKQ